MALINILESIRDLLNKEVCCDYQFKNEPPENRSNAEDYNYSLVHPQAYIWYVPPEGRTPSVTIQFTEGQMKRFEKEGSAKVKLLFATWDTGMHGNNKHFEINQEGWRDVWVFISGTLRKMRNTTFLGKNIRIRHEDGIKFGTISENEMLPNYYPFWCAYIEFSIQFGVSSSDEDVNDVI